MTGKKDSTSIIDIVGCFLTVFRILEGKRHYEGSFIPEILQ